LESVKEHYRISSDSFQFLFNFFRNFFRFLSHSFISSSTQLPKMLFVCGSWSIHAIVSCPMNCARGLIHATQRKR
jgi:hypothetical protein